MNFFPQSPHDLNAVSFNWNIVIVSDTPAGSVERCG